MESLRLSCRQKRQRTETDRVGRATAMTAVRPALIVKPNVASDASASLGDAGVGMQVDFSSSRQDGCALAVVARPSPHVKIPVAWIGR